MSSAPRYRKPTPAHSQFPASALFKGLGSTSSNLKSRGIVPDTGGAPYSNLAPDSPFGRSADQIGSISVQRQKGFTIVDINPYTVSKTTFPCGISPQIIGDLIGYEIQGDFTNNSISSTADFNTALDVPNVVSAQGVVSAPLETGNGTGAGGIANQNANGKTIGLGKYGPQNPWWRTVPIPGAGTWVKIEFLPARVNDESIYAAVNANPITNNVNPSILNTPNQTRLFRGHCRTVAGNASVTSCLANGVAFNGVWAWNDNTVGPNTDNAQAEDIGYGNKQSSNDLILIQFDDPNSVPLIAKHGVAYSLPFNQLYLTFKIRNPRIRITIGNNAKIEEGFDSRTVNAQLHTAPGRGLWENSLLHPVPFTITPTNLGAQTTTPNYGGFQIVGAATSIKKVIRNSSGDGFTPSGIPPGISIFWITSISFSVTSDTALRHHSIGLSIVPFVALQFPNAASKNIWSASGVIATANQMITYSTNLAIPIRCVLRPGDALTLTATNLDGTNNMVYWFSITGYSMGALMPTGTTSGDNPAFRVMGSYTEHPFPHDNWLLGTP